MTVRDFPKTVSIAIPAYNESEVLSYLIGSLLKFKKKYPSIRFDFVFVDDGSIDNTFDLLKESGKILEFVKVLKFSRNFGHQTAVSAALHHSRGEVTVVMDADLQDRPDVLDEFFEKYRLGYDVVYAQRDTRVGSRMKTFLYRGFYRFLQRLAEIEIPLDSGDFSLMSARVVATINSSPERNRYVRGLRAWAGFKQIGIKVNRPAREAGHTKYSYVRLLGLAADGVFSFSKTPLRLATVCGFVAIALNLIFVIYTLYARIFLDHVPSGFAANLVVLVFFSSVQLIFLGVLGEYLGRIYDEVKGRPHYIISEVYEEGQLI